MNRSLLQIALILHANLAYAEIPPDETPKIVNQSYLPVLSGLLKIPKAKIGLSLTGLTLETLSQGYPKAIQLIKEGVSQVKFEVLGGTYSHPIMPLLSSKYQNLQINEHLKLLDKLLGIKKPKGFWLPEAAWNSQVGELILDFGFQWTIIDRELVLDSKKEKKGEFLIDIGVDFLNGHLLKKATALPKLSKMISSDIDDNNFSPIKALLSKNKNLTLLPISQAWSPAYTGVSLMLPDWSIFPWSPTKLKKKILKMAKSPSSRGLFSPFASDLELIGYKGYIPLKINVNRFLDFIKWLTKPQGWEFLFPSEHLKNNPATEKLMVKEGSWGPKKDFSTWTKKQSKKLNHLCQKAEKLIQKMPTGPKKEGAIRELLLAQGSDGRGYNPCPERQKEFLEHAFKAIKLAKEG